METSTLTNQDLSFVVSRLPRDVRNLMQKERVFLAGGFIRATISRDEKPSDIDLLGTSKGDLESHAKDLALAREGRLHKTDNAFTVLTGSRMPVQFIHRWLYDDPEQLLAEFDFTVAQAVIWWEANSDEESEGHWRSLTAAGFYPDLAGKRLVYTAPQRIEDAGGSMLRVRKFVQRGYQIDAFHLGRVMARVFSAINTDSIDITDEYAVGKTVAGLLREVDPLVVVDGLDLVDEHGESS